MARKLTSDEERAFAEALKKMCSPPAGVGDAWVWQSLDNEPEATPSLAREFEQWFGDDPPIGFDS